MKKVFFSVSYKNKDHLSKEILCMKKLLKKFSLKMNVFVSEYSFSPKQEKEMMKKALEEIENSDFFIAEVSEKAIGVGIEMGFAKALKKPILYLRNAGAEHSTTASGISDFRIVYRDTEELESGLSEALTKLISQTRNT